MNSLYIEVQQYFIIEKACTHFETY